MGNRHGGENLTMTDLTPPRKSIRTDRFIIGQNDAKRARAVPCARSAGAASSWR